MNNVERVARSPPMGWKCERPPARPGKIVSKRGETAFSSCFSGNLYGKLLPADMLAESLAGSQCFETNQAFATISFS